MLFAGREPSAKAMKQAPLLDMWTVWMDRYGQRRMLTLVGFRRSAVGEVSTTPGELLWLDRRERFAVTYTGIWRLGEREDEIGMEDDR